MDENSDWKGARDWLTAWKTWVWERLALGTETQAVKYTDGISHPVQMSAQSGRGCIVITQNGLHAKRARGHVTPLRSRVDSVAPAWLTGKAETSVFAAS